MQNRKLGALKLVTISLETVVLNSHLSIGKEALKLGCPTLILKSENFQCIKCT